MNAPFQFTRKSAPTQPCEITFDRDSGVWIAQERGGRNPHAMTPEKAASVMAALRAEGAEITSIFFDESAAELRRMEREFRAESAADEADEAHFAEEFAHMDPATQHALRDVGISY